jgi:L-amino acid N-acyltransferase YncA
MSTIAQLSVRPATSEDMPAVAEIFAHYVERTVVTFELEAPTVESWRATLRALQSAGWPFVVGVVDAEIVGYAHVAPWRTKPAYRHTVENSVYLAPAHIGRGHGRALLDEVVARSADAGARQVIAVIADGDGDSSASTALHHAAGFTRVGCLRDVGFKHNRWIDVVLMQASLIASRR